MMGVLQAEDMGKRKMIELPEDLVSLLQKHLEHLELVAIQVPVIRIRTDNMPLPTNTWSCILDMTQNLEEEVKKVLNLFIAKPNPGATESLRKKLNDGFTEKLPSVVGEFLSYGGCGLYTHNSTRPRARKYMVRLINREMSINNTMRELIASYSEVLRSWITNYGTGVKNLAVMEPLLDFKVKCEKARKLLSNALTASETINFMVRTVRLEIEKNTKVSQNKELCQLADACATWLKFVRDAVGGSVNKVSIRDEIRCQDNVISSCISVCEDLEDMIELLDEEVDGEARKQRGDFFLSNIEIIVGRKVEEDLKSLGLTKTEVKKISTPFLGVLKGLKATTIAKEFSCVKGEGYFDQTYLTVDTRRSYLNILKALPDAVAVEEITEKMRKEREEIVWKGKAKGV